MTLTNKAIAFIGAGNMAEALMRGLLNAKTVAPEQILATDVRADRLSELQGRFAIRTGADNVAAVAGADIVILAVKPQQIGGVLANLKSQITNTQLVVSIAAGVPTGRIERDLGGNVRVIRVMPNMPALVGAGAAALCRGQHATEADLATTETILGAVGIVVRVSEDLLDAVTALSGSGPAYVFFVTEALVAAGVQAGLPEPVAQRLAIQTVMGAGKLMAESKDSPAALRQKVTSPGGTTEAALKVMTARGLTEILRDAVQAATQRGRELSS